jgi:hypothetical protein
MIWYYNHIQNKIQVWTFFWKFLHIQQWSNHNMWCINATLSILNNNFQNNHVTKEEGTQKTNGPLSALKTEHIERHFRSTVMYTLNTNTLPIHAGDLHLPNLNWDISPHQHRTSTQIIKAKFHISLFSVLF